MTMQQFGGLAATLLVVSCLSGAAPAAEMPGPLVDAHFFPPQAPAAVAGFQVLGGDWKVADGVVSVGAGRGPKLVLEEVSLSTGKVGAEVFFTDKGGGNVSLLVKVSDAAVGADNWNGYEISLYADKQVLHLGRHRQNYEPICYVPWEVPVGEWISLSVEMTETTLSIYIQGKLVHQFEDKEHPLRSGQIALRPWQREARYRNLWIEKDGQRQEIPLAAPGNSAPVVCRGWTVCSSGTARGNLSLHGPGPSTHLPSQRIDFSEGQGEVGIAYRDPGSDGFELAGGRPYNGYFWAKAVGAPVDLVLGFRNEAGEFEAQARAAVGPAEMQAIPFSMVARKSCRKTRFVVQLESPGSVELSRVYLEPGDWAWPEELRRESLPPLVVVTRHPLNAPNAVALDLWMSQPRAPGCSLRIVDPTRPGLPGRTVFGDPDGCIYDMNLSDDARTVFFSYRRKGEAHWHLWRINCDGSDLRQLTEGAFYDVSPCPMPGGDVVFVSTRRFGHTVCQPGPASNLYCMSPDGRTCAA